VCVRARERGGERFGHTSTDCEECNKTHIMNLDWVTLLCFDGAVRRRIRRLDDQFIRWRLLLRRHEQSESKNGYPP
jgi:hypothetical protein